MNLKEIKDMIHLMNENDLTELEVEKEGFRIRLKKRAGQFKEELVSVPARTSIPQVTPVTGEEKKEVRKEELLQIRAPMVGTFYRAPSPESSAYVEIGQEIEAGQVVCIIEAMKLMNEIKAEVRGVIKEILVENGDPVEFGQVLFLVEPT